MVWRGLVIPLVVRLPEQRFAAGGNLPEIGGGARGGWTLRGLVRALDGRMRKVQGVYEFSGDTDCILRLSRISAETALRLGDGTVIQPGQPLGILHLWNEHMPVMPATGPNFVWVNRVRRQLKRSLTALATYVEADPAMADIAAFRARVAFFGRGRRAKLVRLCARFGLDRAPMPAAPAGRWRWLHDFLENFWLWGLGWAFNPRSLRGKAFMRHREDLWISRDALIARYGTAPIEARRRARG
jgi:hypothetical protein